MKSYRYPSVFFNKQWYWFTTPTAQLVGDVVNVFSYEDSDAGGFKKKIGLTTVIDLSLSLESIQAHMRKRFVREQVAKGERNGIKIVIGVSGNELLVPYARFREGKGIASDNPRVFASCLNVAAYVEDTIIAGGAFVEDGTHIRALALFSERFTDDGRMREVVGQANRMIVAEMITYAKEHGYALFDLGGIAPESSEQWERTLAEFKEAFGGERKTCYYYSKVNSPLLRLIIKIRRILHI